MQNSGKRKNRGRSLRPAGLCLLLALLILLALAGCSSPAAENPETPTVPPAASPAETDAAPLDTAAPVLTDAPPAAAATPAPVTEPPAASEPAATEPAATEPAASPNASAPTESQPASVTAIPDPAGYEWQPVASGLQSPIGLANAGDGSGRLFVLEKTGQVRLIAGGQLSPEPFLDIRDRVGSGGSEQGLLGLAFHPDYESNGRFFVNYTDHNGDTQIAEFRVTADNPDRANPGSERRLLSIPQPYANHNGGVLAFGPDGYLYAGLGDGGSGGDPLGNGQSTDTLLGKILRIDVDNGDPYAIPPDNPFAGGGGAPEIWAYGLRNPWRFAFDPLTGDLYIGDVGQGSWEEVNFQPAGSAGGENYGWNILEGLECFSQPDCDTSGLTLPVFVYPTHVNNTCSVTGGQVYRGPSLPEWNGVYLFGDYCSGEVWGLVRDAQGAWQNASLFQTGANIASFGQDEAGEVYLVDMGGNVFQLAGR